MSFGNFLHGGVNLGFALMWTVMAVAAWQLWRKGHHEHRRLFFIACTQVALCLATPTQLVVFGTVNQPASALTMITVTVVSVWWWWVNRHDYALLLLNPPPPGPPGKLHIMRGLPGCGKSTWAKQWVAENPQRRARVGRDDLRRMLHGGYVDTFTEEQVTFAQRGAILNLLCAGWEVVVDDTNLEQRHIQVLTDLAKTARASVHFHDLRHVPLETCLNRNALRDPAELVPAEWIIKQHAKHIAPHELRR